MLEGKDLIFVGTMGLKGRYHVVVAAKHPNQLNPIHVGLHGFTV
jgi:hypothetical protein